MRTLIDEGQDNQVELLDGIKVYHDQGSALVLPDAEEPLTIYMARVIHRK